MSPSRWFVAALATLAVACTHAADPARGQAIFTAKCAMCHQPSGLGAPPVFPPLAGSDFFAANRPRVIQALCEGLSDPIRVNGVEYRNVMPAQVLDDDDAAAVLTFVATSWGNRAAPFAADEVKAARRKTKFATYDALVQASSFAPLPAAPAGWTVRTVVELPEFCTRFARGPHGGDVYLLAQTGDVYRLDVAHDSLGLIIPASDYLDAARGDAVCLGLMCDERGRLWIVSNQQLKHAPGYVTNEVVIYRTSADIDGVPARPLPWFKTSYPYGVGPYNHGVSHLALGPDGMLYVSSGSRTDGGERGNDPRYYPGGEVDITACLWRLDPRAAEPGIAVVARGIRNAYGFAWDNRGQLFTVSNGPDADAPEEMDAIEPGRHYGFPYQFSNWPVEPGSPYPHTPPPPPGLEFTPPVVNVGPAGGASANTPLSTFDAHSSPAGMIWCGDEFPAPLRGGFLVPRFGNLLGGSHAPRDVGFDLLSCHVQKTVDGQWQVRTETVLAPLGRPLDTVATGGGRALILEYTRPTDFKSQLGWLPGRVIELAPKQGEAGRQEAGSAHP